MPTLAEFYAQVSAELRRGTSLDASIPAKVRQALRWMEGQYTFKHMENFTTPSLATRGISIPAGMKKVEFWRLIKPDDGGFRYLNLINPRDISHTETAMPNGYWESKDEFFWLDNTPDQAYSSELLTIVYTVLPTDTALSPDVIQRFESVLLHQTCLMMAPLMRDDDFMLMHKAMRDEMMKAAIDADVERRQANEDNSVVYGWEFRERTNQW